MGDHGHKSVEGEFWQVQLVRLRVVGNAVIEAGFAFISVLVDVLFKSGLSRVFAGATPRELEILADLFFYCGAFALLLLSLTDVAYLTIDCWRGVVTKIRLAPGIAQPGAVAAGAEKTS